MLVGLLSWREGKDEGEDTGRSTELARVSNGWLIRDTSSETIARWMSFIADAGSASGISQPLLMISCVVCRGRTCSCSAQVNAEC